MYYCKNTGCITKNALGARYDDFVKHEKMWIFSKKIGFASVPYRTLQTRANDDTSCLLPKKTRVPRRKMLWVAKKSIAKKSQIGSKSNFLYVPHRTPIPYRFLKTRANIYKSDIQPKKHVSRVELSSGGKIVQKTAKFGKFLHFLTSRTTPLDPTGRQKHVR